MDNDFHSGGPNPSENSQILERRLIERLDSVLMLEPLLDKPEIFERGVKVEDLKDHEDILMRYVDAKNRWAARSGQKAVASDISTSQALAELLKTADDEINPFRVNKLGVFLIQLKDILREDWDQNYDDQNTTINKPNLHKTVDEVLGERAKEIAARVEELQQTMTDNKLQDVPVSVADAKEIFAMGKLAKHILNRSLSLKSDYSAEDLLAQIKPPSKQEN